MTVTGYWLDQAACLSADPAVFEARTPQGQQAAIRDYCRRCPVRANCLADALATAPHQDHGVRGAKTRKQRQALRKRTDIPTGQDAVTIAALRQLLDAEQPEIPRHPAPRTPRRAPKEKPVPTTPTPAPVATELEKLEATVQPKQLAPVRGIGELIDWAAQHKDAGIRKHAGQARTALDAIQRRHAADTELQRVTSEADELRQRLAELDARAKQLGAPAGKAKAKVQRDYDGAIVRTWAKERGIPCPGFGQIPKAVLTAWRERDAA